MLKCSLDRSFTAHKLRTFQKGYLSVYFNLVWVYKSEETKFYVRLATSKMTAEGQISAFFRAALKHGIRNPESGNGITETETETETESIIIQEAVKNIPRYYTLNRRIRYIYYSTRGVQNCGPLLITRIRDIPT